MDSSAFLQIFLFINIFLIGALSAIAARHAYAHFHPQSHEPLKPHPTAQTVRVPQDIREHLVQDAEKSFQKTLDQSVAQLQSDLSTTTTSLNKQLQVIGNDIISNEMKRYASELEELRRKAEAVISGAQTGVAEHEATLKAELTASIEAEKQRLLAQLDTKLADAVASFLIDTMQHNVDLGAQLPYLTAMLNEHKDEFKKDVA